MRGFIPGQEEPPQAARPSARPDTRRWAYVGWNIYFPSDLPLLRSRLAEAERIAARAIEVEDAAWYRERARDLLDAITTLEQADA